MTTLLIPGENDADEEIETLSAWFVRELGPDVPLHVTAFHPDWKMRDKPPTPAATLARARRIAMRHGLRHVYTGNVHDRDGQSTWCHGCGERLVGRDRYRLDVWNLDTHGSCRRCDTPCAGVFEARPGTWGLRRMPVAISADSSV